MPALAPPTAVLTDLIFYPVDGAPGIGQPVDRLLSAITGGVMTGWGIMIYLLVSEVVPTHPSVGRRLILASIGAWYVVDSGMSLAAGAPLNVLSNTGFLLLFVVPAWSLGNAERPAPAGTA